MFTDLTEKNLADARRRSDGRLFRNECVGSCPKTIYGGPASSRLWQLAGEMESKIVHNMNKAVFENS